LRKIAIDGWALITIHDEIRYFSKSYIPPMITIIGDNFTLGTQFTTIRRGVYKTAKYMKSLGKFLTGPQKI